MKSRFKVLSLATAVLFATSCSKDDNSDSIVDEVQQEEEVVVNERSVTVSGKATSQSGLSKLTVATTSSTHTVSFDGNETIKFGEGEKIHGTGSIDENGSFKLNIQYPAKDEQGEDTNLGYLNGAKVTLCIGTKPTGIEVKSSLDNTEFIYEEAKDVTFTVTKDEVSGEYTFEDLTVTFEPKVAIIYNDFENDCIITMGETTEDDFDKGEYAIVTPGEVTISYAGNSKNKTVIEGKFYTLTEIPPAAK